LVYLPFSRLEAEDLQRQQTFTFELRIPPDNTAMKCIKCPSELRCKLSIATEETDLPVEISYQWWLCENCGAKYYATLEDSHVNMFDDRLLHKGFLADEVKWQKTLKWGMNCPDRQDKNCKCEVHQGVTSGGFSGEFAWYTND